jgi:hypothetical protein
MIAIAALFVSLASLIISVYIFRRSRRPIVTVAVKTHSGGDEAICYDLVVRNSGPIPARNIRIQLAEDGAATLDPAFGREASEDNKKNGSLASMKQS